jgi:hypothetical protein
METIKRKTSTSNLTDNLAKSNNDDNNDNNNDNDCIIIENINDLSKSISELDDVMGSQRFDCARSGKQFTVK